MENCQGWSSKAYSEVGGKEKSTRDRDGMWWWNEEAKNTIARKKAAFRELCRLTSEDNKFQYKGIRNQTRKVVAKAMRKEARQELNIFCQNSNSVFSFFRRIKKKGRDFKGERYLRGRDRRLGFIEEGRAKIGSDHLEKIMN